MGVVQITPMNRHATAADFTRWEEMAETMTDSELHYASVDCFHTAANWRGVDAVIEGYYLDQGCTYGDTLRRRASIWASCDPCRQSA